MLESLFAPIGAVDWNDLDAVDHANSELLHTLDDDRNLLADLVVHASRDERLLGLSESLDHLDKIVLHDDPGGWRLRLHIFTADCEDWPHNHRWTFTSRILEGSYGHVLYGVDGELGESSTARELRELYRRTEAKGDTYTIHHSTVHAALGRPGTISLLVRGPSVKDRFIVFDRVSGNAWWRYGAAKEQAQVAAAKVIDPNRVRAHVERLKQTRVIGRPLAPAHDLSR